MMARRVYHYTARGLDGVVVRGSIESLDARSVLDVLRSRALFVTAIGAEHAVGGRLGRALHLGGIPSAELLTFFRSFATLIRAGVSMQRSLTVTIERAVDARLRETLRAVLASVEHGAPLSVALARHPYTFAPLYVGMIAAGETGGILDDVLERLAVLLEREAALRRGVRTALAYPLIVTVAATALLMFTIVAIVPMFAQLFDSLHVDLPPSTRALLWLSSVLGRPLPWVSGIGATITAAFAAYRIAGPAACALAADRFRLRLPIAGRLMHQAISARIIRMLATLLRAGVELTAAIDAVAGVAGSPLYASALERMNTALREGQPLAQPLTDSGLFDPVVLALVGVGEETGLLDEMLHTLAGYLERDVEATIATLGAVIEPALIILLGGGVGLIVCSIFLPLYSLIGNISK